MELIRPVQYKANLHCHSTLSDGKLTPEQLKAAYKARGYSILSITDHERPCDHSALSEPDFLMLTGYEAYIRPDPACRYNTYQPEVHLNLFARDRHNVDLICWNDGAVKYVRDPVERAAIKRYGSEETREYTPDYINRFIRTAQEDGYIVSFNHPVWSMESHTQIFGYEGCFSMEMCNYSSFRSGLCEYNSALYDMLLRQGKRIFVHSADDNHNECGLCNPGDDSFGGFAMLNTADDALTYDSVFQALENGTFYSSMGPTIRSLTIENGVAHLRCSEAAYAAMIYGGKDTRCVYPQKEGEFVTSARFRIPREAPYVRFSVKDRFGRYADTRGYFMDEIADAL